jgi:hypothetical protein
MESWVVGFFRVPIHDFALLFGIRFGVLIQLESYIPSDRRFTLIAVADSIYCRTGRGLMQ